MTSRARKLFVALASTIALAGAGAPALAWAAPTAGPASGAAAAPTASATPGADADTPPSAVEDFSYPDAARILQDKKIKLIKGDGHIMLTDCGASDQQIHVMSTTGDVCFRTLGKTGYLSLEIPRVFYLETVDHPISADLSANGTTKTVNIAQGGFQSVGEGTPGGARSVLLELRVTG
ncbi:hypothetical protein ACFC1R_04715 [Kitasatospora sp. NPDC056138]|uniref:hypothetical protein n=1 Tax=Kitasatospora sp. NPDC056138 TaxID=3345724 RepID=UPI0035D73F46